MFGKVVTAADCHPGAFYTADYILQKRLSTQQLLSREPPTAGQRQSLARATRSTPWPVTSPRHQQHQHNPRRLQLETGHEASDGDADEEVMFSPVVATLDSQWSFNTLPHEGAAAAAATPSRNKRRTPTYKAITGYALPAPASSASNSTAHDLACLAAPHSSRHKQHHSVQVFALDAASLEEARPWATRALHSHSTMSLPTDALLRPSTSLVESSLSSSRGNRKLTRAHTAAVLRRDGRIHLVGQPRSRPNTAGASPVKKLDLSSLYAFACALCGVAGGCAAAVCG